MKEQENILRKIESTIYESIIPDDPNFGIKLSANECRVILSFLSDRDKFAIGFAEWAYKESSMSSKDAETKIYHYKEGKYCTEQELIDLYKQSLTQIQ